MSDLLDTDTIRGLSEGDEVRVGYTRVAQHEQTLLATVTNVSPGDHPLVDLDDEVHEGTVALEYDEHYTQGTPYNLRVLSEPEMDGASVTSIEVVPDE